MSIVEVTIEIVRNITELKLLVIAFIQIYIFEIKKCIQIYIRNKQMYSNIESNAIIKLNIGNKMNQNS